MQLPITSGSVFAPGSGWSPYDQRLQVLEQGVSPQPRPHRLQAPTTSQLTSLLSSKRHLSESHWKPISIMEAYTVNPLVSYISGLWVTEKIT